MFKLNSNYKPTGGQPDAISQLLEGFKKKNKEQTLLGVTGSGKTFVSANIINEIQRPTLIISHNKTLAGQLYQEFRDFFPENAVEYFVSYYDYYQPESYLPSSDTYIEKDADINEEIDKLRLSATASLLTRKDVIVVASVSCIYNLGSPAEYMKQIIELREGIKFRQMDLTRRLTELYYDRNDYDFKRGTFRIKGDTIDIHPAYQYFAIRIEFLGDTISDIKYFDPVSGEIITPENANIIQDSNDNHLTKAQEDFVKSHTTRSKIVTIYPAKHYVAPQDTFQQGIKEILADLDIQLNKLNKEGKKIEAYRLEQRTKYDIEMMQEIGFCKGIENYSRYFDQRKPGEPPYSLLDFFPEDYLLFIDESHITVPQIRGMYNGDRARKQTLIDYGFRLPSALDNRPLKFDEFERRMGQTVYTSATPNEWETQRSKQVVELLIRPTGLIDPEIEIKPTKGQVEDLKERIKLKVSNKQRVLVTTLTKRMAEELSDYLNQEGMKVAYLHSDIETLERSDILDSLRKGTYDVLIGINLLREGLDLPEVGLVAILDADKEGFLRSETSLIQTMGRAARHVDGKVIMYADKITGSMDRAIKEIDRRRNIQIEYNKKHNITPETIIKPIRERIMQAASAAEILDSEILPEVADYEFKTFTKKKQKDTIKVLEQKMKSAAELLEFETAAEIRDKLREYKQLQTK